MKSKKRQRIEVAICRKPHLFLVEQDVQDISRRVSEYDEDMFVVFNADKQKYELHSLESHETYQMTFPFKELDARALRHIWENDIRVHGRSIFRNVERSEDEFKKRKDRDYRNWVRDVAAETQNMFAKDAWTM